MKMTEQDKMDKLMDKIRAGFTEKEFDYAGPIQITKIMDMAGFWFQEMNENNAWRSLSRDVRFGCRYLSRKEARDIYREMKRIDNECWNLRGAHRFDAMRKYLLELREEKIIDFKTTKAKKWNVI